MINFVVVIWSSDACLRAVSETASAWMDSGPSDSRGNYFWQMNRDKNWTEERQIFEISHDACFPYMKLKQQRANLAT